MRYWIYLGGEVPGQYEPGDLVTLPGFTDNALVCPCDGDLSERKWQPAAAIGEIARAIETRPPAPPAQSLPFSQVVGPEQVLDQTNIRLFRHVSRIMKQLEAHRSERTLIETLQRTLDETKEALKAAQKEIGLLKDRVTKLPELETRCEDLESTLAKTRRENSEHIRDVDDLRARLESGERELAAAKTRMSAMEGEKRAVDERLSELNRALAGKDLSLTKSLAALSRVEKELGQLADEASGAGKAPETARTRTSNIDVRAAGEEKSLPAEENAQRAATPEPVEEAPRQEAKLEEIPPPVPEAPPPPPPIPEMPRYEKKKRAVDPREIAPSVSIQSELEEIFRPTPPKTIPMTPPPPMPDFEEESPVIHIAPPWRQALDRKLSELKDKLFGNK